MSSYSIVCFAHPVERKRMCHSCLCELLVVPFVQFHGCSDILEIGQTEVLVHLHTPSCVHLLVHRNISHEKRAQETETRNARHDLPYHCNTVTKCIAYFVLQRLGKVLDQRNGGICKLETRSRSVGRVGDLVEELLRKVLAEFILENGTANCDTPYLEVANEYHIVD